MVVTTQPHHEKGWCNMFRTKLAAVTAFLFVALAGVASAAADPVTGIDYKVDVADKVISAAQPAILAGLAIMVLVVAITLGKRLWGKISGAH